MRKFERRETRSYNKSDHPRLRWTNELHQHFVQVVEGLGGKYKATPKRIMQMMGVQRMKISHIKSHLQMYRCNKDQTRKDEVDSIKRLNNNIVYENIPVLDICSLQRDKVTDDMGAEYIERNQHEGPSNWKQNSCHNITSTTRENMFKNYNQDTHWSIISDISKEEDDSEGLHFNQSTYINLELSISTCFSKSSDGCN